MGVPECEFGSIRPVTFEQCIHSDPKGTVLPITINHRRELRSERVGWEHRQSPGQASKADLLWHFFPGDVEIIADDAALVSAFGSVPALHFVAAVIEAKDALVMN